MMNVMKLFHLICHKLCFEIISFQVQICHSVTKVSLFVAGVIIGGTYPKLLIKIITAGRAFA